MLRFKQYINESLLVENRIEFIKQQNPDIDSSHDALAKHRDASNIIDHFANNADPTSTKEHIQWIVNKYKQHDFRQEDAPRIREALTDFKTHKASLPKKDINQYKHLSDVEDAVLPYKGQLASNKQVKKQIKDEGAESVYDSPTLSVHKLKTQEASCQYGAGTKWCTAAKTNNRFDQYNSAGPLYVVNHKDTGEKRQYHFATNEFKEEKDRPIKLAHEVQKHPELTMVKEFKDSPSHGYHFASSKQEFNTKMDTVLNHPDKKIRTAAIQHPKATAEHITKALNDKDTSVRSAAIQHPEATAEHITKALNDKEVKVRSSVIANPKATNEHLSKVLDDRDPKARISAIRHPKVTAEHITKALDDSDSGVRNYAIKHRNVTAEHITKALDDSNYFVRLDAISHPKATTQHITKALHDGVSVVRMHALSHPKATVDHITKALDDNEGSVRKYAAERLAAIGNKG